MEADAIARNEIGEILQSSRSIEEEPVLDTGSGPSGGDEKKLSSSVNHLPE